MACVFTRLVDGIAALEGQPLAFVIALVRMILSGVVGPLFHCSDTWQLATRWQGTMSP